MSGSDEAAPSGWSPNALTPEQSRAARALLDWPVATLAAKVGLEEKPIRDFEAGYTDAPSGTLEALRSVMTAAGVVFTDGDQPGVRLGRHGADEGTRLDELTTENDR